MVEGGAPLRGEVFVSGAKNAALPLMAASLLVPGELILENVPALRCPRREKNHPEKTQASYFGRVVGDLAASGYRVRWDCIPASAVGAPHQRDRLWIVAHAGGRGRHGRADEQGKGPPGRMRAGEGRDAMADPALLLGEAVVGGEPHGVLSQDVSHAPEDGRRTGWPG